MSSGGELPTISIASITIGFISFSFTLLIWINNFWSAFITIAMAPKQLRDELATLRQGLYEEREHLKQIRRRKVDRRGELSQIYVTGGPLKVINDAVKDLVNDFKDLERPFLMTDHVGREKDLDWSYDATQQQYGCNLHQRIAWLKNKGAVENIASQLNALQIRRIAIEVSECHTLLCDAVGMIRRSDDRLAAIESRLRMSQIG